MAFVSVSWTIGTYVLYTLITLLIIVAGLSSIFIGLQFIRISQAPPSIPWVGLKDRRYFSKLRACLSELTVGRSMVDEGYEKYSKQDKPFVIPGMHWNGVVLPPSNTAWLAHQPESSLSGNKTMDDTLGLEYLVLSSCVESCRDFTVIRKDLTRQLINLTPQILDEIASCLDEELGLEEEWRDVKLNKCIEAVAFRSTNRLFVGSPWCRSRRYKQAVTCWSFTFACGILFLRYLVPVSAKRIMMPVVAVPAMLAELWATSYLKSSIRQRLRLRAGGHGVKQENDMMQWIINENAQKGDPAELEPSVIAGKMLLLNVFATSTTSLALGSLFFNLLPHKDAPVVLDELRAEAESIMPRIEQDGRVLRDSVKLDSVIRETLRYHLMGAQGLIREVVKPGGIETPDGVYLPEGTHVHAVVSSMQRDPDVHGEKADQYDPLRFYHQANTAGTDDSGYDNKRRRMMAVQVGNDYLSFGLGKHACPGRFFAVHVLKLVVTYLLTHYDVEPLKERPKFDTFGEVELPSSKTVVRLRRRPK